MGLELTTTRLEDAAKWAKQSALDRASNWGRKFSLFTYPFVTACCGMEFMSVAAPKYDLARFGAEFPRFSPRQSDLLMIVGTITEKQGRFFHLRRRRKIREALSQVQGVMLHRQPGHFADDRLGELLGFVGNGRASHEF